ncbi:hypothetical protein [Flavobacterium sp. UMI-01]|uniref:hypothetical protein n=1 Tax=Flavobacterium sp. UMI-01 TaxID=1441053 RepID=UPI001C7CAF3B|nr:hypothetical protein [Flavobacterium sp. UMI-01]GIZ07616.1 hypothetical protein FUMI01_03430 [Flavobacterium sp. UMI-01]
MERHLPSHETEVLFFELFKTDVLELPCAMMILQEIKIKYPYLTCNFDLEDCDKILRIVSTSLPINIHEIILLVTHYNHSIEVMD